MYRGRVGEGVQYRANGHLCVKMEGSIRAQDELHGDSLAALELFAQAREEYGVGVARDMSCTR